MSQIQIRIDEKTKKSAKKVLDRLGLDMTSAIKLYLKQIVATESIPFRLITENGLTIEQEMEILKASEEAKRGENVVGPFETADELLDHLNSLK